MLAEELAEASSLGVVPRPAGAAIQELAGQRIKWAVLESGELVIIPHSVRPKVAGIELVPVEISHAVLSGGAPVRAAGEALIMVGPNGQLQGSFISSYSGHFFKGKSVEAAAALPQGEEIFGSLNVYFQKRITP